ncbi:hypothetical protein QZH41_006950 [Actinostola sp. cb2023]|nr:hypothetical protein QZH41_006950 [Actinostola sp. cb2023]
MAATETVANYSADIRRQCQLLRMPKPEWLHVFIQGLRADIREHLVLQQPQSFEQAEQLATLKEAVSKPASTPPSAQQLAQALLSQLQPQPPAPAKTQHVAAFSTSFQNDDRPDEAVTMSSIRSMIQTELRKALKDNFAQSDSRPRDSGYNAGRFDNRNRNHRTPDGHPICNTCNRRGHTSYNCHTLREPRRDPRLPDENRSIANDTTQPEYIDEGVFNDPPMGYAECDLSTILAEDLSMSLSSKILNYGFPLLVNPMVDIEHSNEKLELSHVDATKGSPEKNLREKLFDPLNYDRSVRPVIDHTKPINVSFGMRLSKLIEVNTKHQLVVINAWVVQKWLNPYLAWNQTEHKGIHTLHVPAESVWVPDTVLYDNGDEAVSQAGFTEKFKTYVLVESSGMCTWSAPATFKSSCNMDITNFPFDSQTCDMTFGSWTYDDRLMSMQQLHGGHDQAETFLFRPSPSDFVIHFSSYQKWLNPYLAWNQTEHKGIHTLHVPADTVWVPDTVLYDNGDDEVSQAGFTEKFKTYVLVESSGMCTWSAPATFKSSCDMDITNFPFDSQTCNMTFGSWTYDDRLMSMQQMDAKHDQADDVSAITNDTYEKKLRDQLFDPNYYDKTVRPVRDPNRPINVSFSLRLSKLVELASECIIVVPFRGEKHLFM